MSLASVNIIAYFPLMKIRERLYHSSSQRLTSLFSFVRMSLLPPIGNDSAIICRVPSSTVRASGIIYVFFILLENLFAVNNVDALLSLAHALTSEVEDFSLSRGEGWGEADSCCIIFLEAIERLDFTTRNY